MRVLVDARFGIENPYSSIGIYTRRILEQWAQSPPPFDVVLACRSGKLGGGSFPCVAVGHNLNPVRYNLEVTRLADRLQCDAYWQPNHFVILRPKTSSVVVTIHDLLPLSYPEFSPLRGRVLFYAGIARTIRSTHCIITPSRYTAQQIASLFPHLRKPITIVPLGVQLEEPFLEDPTMAPPTPYILFIGRLCYRKGLDLLLQAFRLIKRSVEHTLVLVGEADPWARKLMEHALPNPHLIWFRQVGENTKAWLLHNASLLVFPTRGEGFGLPPLEAMACGTLVLASDIPVVRETTHDSAFYFSLEGKHQTLAREMMRVLSLASSEAESYKARATRVAATYSWQQASRQLAQTLVRTVENA